MNSSHFSPFVLQMRCGAPALFGHLLERSLFLLPLDLWLFRRSEDEIMSFI